MFAFRKMWFQDCNISGLTGDLVNISLNCNPGMLRDASQILVFIVWLKMFCEKYVIILTEQFIWMNNSLDKWKRKPLTSIGSVTNSFP